MDYPLKFFALLFCAITRVGTWYIVQFCLSLGLGVMRRRIATAISLQVQQLLNICVLRENPGFGRNLRFHPSSNGVTDLRAGIQWNGWNSNGILRFISNIHVCACRDWCVGDVVKPLTFFWSCWLYLLLFASIRNCFTQFTFKDGESFLKVNIFSMSSVSPDRSAPEDSHQ